MTIGDSGAPEATGKRENRPPAVFVVDGRRVRRAVVSEYRRTAVVINRRITSITDRVRWRIGTLENRGLSIAVVDSRAWRRIGMTGAAIVEGLRKARRHHLKHKGRASTES